MNINNFTTKRTGRSIEETIVRRNFDRTNPITWPEVINNNINQQPLVTNNTITSSNSNFQHDNNNKNINLMSQSLNINLTSTAKEKEINSKLAHVLSDYSENDKMNMMESLVRYTRTLQSRVQELEGHIARNGNSKFAIKKNLANIDNNYDQYAMIQTLGNEVSLLKSKTNTHQSNNNNHNNSNNTNRSNTSTTSNLNNNRPGSGINKSISDIDHRILGLKELFRNGDPIAERHHACTKICALVRGYLIREKLSKYLKGIREWRWIRCRPVTFLLDILLAKYAKRDAGLYLIKVNRNMKILLEIYSKWASVYRKNAPIRRMVKRLAEEKIEFKKYQFLKLVFDSLKSVSVGELSSRKANAVRRKMIEEIRKDLSQQFRSRGLLGVVPDTEIFKALGKKVLETFKTSQKLLKMKSIFHVVLKIRDRARLHWKEAVKHHFTVLVGRYFYSWSDHIYLVARGLDRKRWPGPRKYEVKYNQKRVDNFRSSVCKRTIFKAWQAYFGIQLKVKSMYQRKISIFLYDMFLAWAEVSHKQHKIRLITYENWKDYARVMMTKPFNAWARMIVASKNHMNEQIRICNSYVRWKWRSRILTILKVWRHQALYGRIDGLYSRQMLLKTLAEQKFAANTLQKIMADQTIELEECRMIANTEIDKRKKIEEELQEANKIINKNKMTAHHFQEELRRVESVITAMQLINPNQMKHIRQKQIDFKFKERTLISKELLEGSGINIENVDNKQQSTEMDTTNKNLSIDNTPIILETTISNNNKNKDVFVEGRSVDHNSIVVENKTSAGISTTTTDEPNLVKIKTKDVMIEPIVENNNYSDELENKEDNLLNDDNLIETSAPISPSNNGIVKNDDVLHAKSLLYNAYLEDRDKVLLIRAKWLTDRFQNTKAILEKSAHQKTSLDLMIDNHQPLSPDLSTSKSTTNDIINSDITSPNKLNMNNVISDEVSDVNSISSTATDSKTVAFTLAERPPLLPIAATSYLNTNNTTAITATNNNTNSGIMSSSLNLTTQKSSPKQEHNITITKEAIAYNDTLTTDAEQVSKLVRELSRKVLSDNNKLLRQFSSTSNSSGITRQRSTKRLIHQDSLLQNKTNNHSKKLIRGNTILQSMKHSPLASSPNTPIDFNNEDDDINNDYYDDESYDLDENAQLIEEMDVLKNAAVKILLSIIEFLDNGDINAFQSEDRRHWARYLLHSADINSINLPNNTVAVDTNIDKDIVTKKDISKTSVLLTRLDSTSALFEATEESSDTWGTKLMEIRSMFPDAGNYSGKSGSALDDPNDINMFKRILEMRKNLNNIIDLQTKKYQKQLITLLNSDSSEDVTTRKNTNTNTLTIQNNNNDINLKNNFSIYSSNLKNFIDD